MVEELSSPASPVVKSKSGIEHQASTHRNKRTEKSPEDETQSDDDSPVKRNVTQKKVIASEPIDGLKDRIGKISKAYEKLNKGKGKQVDNVPGEGMDVDDEEVPYRPVTPPARPSASRPHPRAKANKKAVLDMQNKVSAHLQTAFQGLTEEVQAAILNVSLEEIMENLNKLARKSIAKTRDVEHMRSPKHKRPRH